MRQLVWIVVMGLCAGMASGSSGAQTTRSAACDAAPFHALDFWLGAWDVRTGQDQQAGSSIVELTADGCSVLEHWTSPPGLRRFIGVGLHVHDPATKSWRQIWSDSTARVVDMKGVQLNDGFRYEWRAPDATGRVLDKRYTLTQTDGGGVRQLGERSADGGKTWTMEYEYRYRRH